MEFVTDEEAGEQNLTVLLKRLQDEMREWKDTTELEIQATDDNLQQKIKVDATNNEIIHNEIRDLRNMFHALEEANMEMQGAIAQLKQQLHDQVSTPTPSAPQGQQNTSSSLAHQSSMIMTSPVFQRNSTFHSGLPQDTFSLMMMSPINSKAWLLGICTLAFQIALLTLIGGAQLTKSDEPSFLVVPFKVDTTVHIGQLFTIIFAIAWQNDVITSIRILVMFWNDPHWDRTILCRDEEEPLPKTAEWIVHIVLPNVLKFLQGIFVVILIWMYIVQSEENETLLTGFLGLIVASETDRIVFFIAANGFFGSDLQSKTIEAQNIKIQCEASHSNGTTSVSSTANRDFLVRPLILFLIITAMIGGWVNIVIGQRNGRYFELRYPGCNFPDALELASEHFGDGICYGGLLNSLGCEFEGGDCVDFNMAYPLCKGGDDRTNVQKSVGDGYCDPIFMNPECNYDGGDCCPYEIINMPSFGDGLCNGGRASTYGCGYDSGDCINFTRAYPDCPLDDLFEMEGAENVVLGNGVCDSGIYNIQDCGWENGDCDFGQIGQDFRVDGANDAFPVFTTVISRDGTTLAVGSWDLDSTGFVNVYKYDELRALWMARGKTMTGEERSDYGAAISLSDTGHRMALAAPNANNGLGQVWVVDYVPSDASWVQVGQTFQGSGGMSWMGQKVELTGDGSRLAIAEPSKDIGMYALAGQISVYELNITQKIWDPLGSAISGSQLFTFIGYETLRLNSDDGNILVFSSRESFGTDDNVAKVYKYDLYSRDWMQLGDDIQNPSPGDSVISSDGSRILFAMDATRSDTPGYVQAFEFDKEATSWEQVGSAIYSVNSSEGNGFGYRMAMSHDGQLLSISSVDPDCDGFPTLCATGLVELHLFDPSENDFMGVIGKHWETNVVPRREKDIEHSIFGNGLSLSGDGSMMAINGYNLQDHHGFIRVYQVNDWFYPRCIAKDAEKLIENHCHDEYPYNSDLCDFDGGSCPLPQLVEDLPGCFVSYPNKIGNGVCDYLNLQMYNTSECAFDGGDCLDDLS